MFGYEGDGLQAKRNEGVVHGVAWEWLVWLSGLVFCVLQALALIGSGSLREFYFISDLLYVPAFVEDIARWSGNVTDWRSPPSPYYFPDIPLYAAARAVGLSIEWSQYTSGLALLLFCIWSGRRVIVNSAPALKETSACIAVLAALGISMLSGCTVNWLAQLSVISVHGGTALGTFGVLALCFVRRPFGRLHLGALAAFAFVMGASDALYAASCGIPLLGLGAVEFVRRRRAPGVERSESGAFANRCWYAGGAALLGIIVSSAIHGQTTARYVQPRASHWADSFYQLTSDLTGPARSATLLLMVSVGVAMFVVIARPKAVPNSLRALALWHVISALSTIVAMVLGGRYSDIGRMRYLIVPLAMSGVMLSIVAAYVLELAMQASDLARPLLAFLIVCIVGIGAWRDVQVIKNGTYSANIRRQIACVQAARGEQRDSIVLTDYWNAKPLMLFSSGDVRALQMEQGLEEPRWWINSRGWYRDARHFGLVITNNLGRDEIAKRYGSPSNVQHCGDLELYVYRGDAQELLSKSMVEKFQRFLNP